MELIRQPIKSKLCGQSTIAMIAGISLDESIKLFGHSNTTYNKDYLRVLRELGIKHDKIKKVDGRKKLNLPNKAIVRIQYVGRKTGHLMAYQDGKFYDPSRGVFNNKEELMNDYKIRYRCRVRIDWYMEILEINENEIKKASGE